MVDPEQCRACARRVPWLSLWGNLGLGIYKLAVGLLGRSSALVADALHSFADVVGSTGILICTRVSSKDPDQRFPYGRGKAEFIGAIFVYTVLLFFGAGIMLSAVRSMLAKTMETPHFVTLLGAVVSVLYNYVMYKYATCVGMRNRSPAILADAFENRADAISSVACIAGILGAMYLHPICDPIAALLVGVIIFWNCQEQLREAARGLMDPGLDADVLQNVEAAARANPYVTDVAFVRSRCTGAKFWIDLGVEVSSEVSVQQADEVVAAIRKQLKRMPEYHHAEIYVLSENADHAPLEDAIA